MGNKKEKITDPDYLIAVEVYDLDIAVFWSKKSAIKNFKANYKYDLTESLEGGLAHAGYYPMEDGSRRFYIVMSDEAGLEHYPHEALHMVDYICFDLGIDLDESTMEPRAYLLQYIFKELVNNSPWLRITKE